MPLLQQACRCAAQRQLREKLVLERLSIHSSLGSWCYCVISCGGCEAAVLGAVLESAVWLQDCLAYMLGNLLLHTVRLLCLQRDVPGLMVEHQPRLV